MTTLTATYDGEVLRPDSPIGLKPNTRVRVTIETTESTDIKKRSFLKTARSLNLQGPADWSARLEDYLYPEKNDRHERSIS